MLNIQLEWLYPLGKILYEAFEQYVVLGGGEDVAAKEYSIPSPSSRHPWEIFEEVGFRCALSVKRPNN